MKLKINFAPDNSRTMTWRRFFAVTILFLFLAPSCSEYNKVLKSTNYKYKARKAFEYYNKKDWTRAQALYEEVLPLVRLTDSGQLAYYNYCYTHYYLKEFYLASYYFKNFSKLYASSPRAEECLFMSGVCNLKNSPRWSLDQTETNEAIRDFQQFLDKYPESSRKDSANQIIDNLHRKLDLKAFNNAKLYFTIQNYKSASVALKSVIDRNPNTIHKEEAMYIIVKSDFLLAENSIDSKKLERYEQTIKSYVNFVASYPESRWRRETESIYKQAVKEVTKIKEVK